MSEIVESQNSIRRGQRHRSGCGGMWRQNRIQSFDNSRCTCLKCGVGNFHRVAPSKVADIGGQVRRSRHLRPSDQHWNDPNLLFERHCQFVTNIVVLVVDSATAVVVGTGKPAWADNGDQRRAGSDSRVEHLNEILTRRDRVDIDEHTLFPECPHSRSYKRPACPALSSRR